MSCRPVTCNCGKIPCHLFSSAPVNTTDGSKEDALETAKKELVTKIQQRKEQEDVLTALKKDYNAQMLNATLRYMICAAVTRPDVSPTFTCSVPLKGMANWDDAIETVKKRIKEECYVWVDNFSFSRSNAGTSGYVVDITWSFS